MNSDVHQVEQSRPERQRFLDDRRAEKRQQTHQHHHGNCAGCRRYTQQGENQFPRRRAHHRENQDDQGNVGDLVEDPGRAQQMSAEGPVVVGARHPSELVGRSHDDTEDQAGDHDTE